MKVNRAIFSHGKLSHPKSTKIQCLEAICRIHGYHPISIDYRSIHNPSHRVNHLLSFYESSQDDPTNKIILIGSSQGGYVSTVASKIIKPNGLFLLSPAIGLKGYDIENPIPYATKTEIIHGWNDTIVPIQNVVDYSMRHKCNLHILNDMHNLHASMDIVGYIFDKFLLDIELSK